MRDRARPRDPRRGDGLSWITVPEVLKSEANPIEAEYELILSEVTQLRREMTSLRRWHWELRRVSSTSPPIDHKLRSDIMEANQERRFVTRDKATLKKCLHDTNLLSFEKHLHRERRWIRAVRQQCLENDIALDDVQFQIDELRDSLTAWEVRGERKLIQNLQNQLDALTERAASLKEELEDAQQALCTEFTEEDDPSGEIKGLFDKLRVVSEVRDASAQRLRDLRGEQAAEIADELTRILEKIRTLRSIFVGWLDESVSPQEIRELFERFGRIRSIVIAPRDKRFCAHLLFETHRAAERAIEAMNGLVYCGERLLVVWNDEFTLVRQQDPEHKAFMKDETEVISTDDDTASDVA